MHGLFLLLFGVVVVVLLCSTDLSLVPTHQLIHHRNGPAERHGTLHFLLWSWKRGVSVKMHGSIDE
jgi:hypothetical protein